MGKIILCTGTIANEPFLFPRTDTKIYSVEELCYYIYNNIYILSEDDFKIEMVDWMELYLNMPVTALKLKNMIRKKESLKDIVVTILCSADYYEEEEIKKLIRVMDKLENSSTLQRMKLRGDNFLKKRDFKNAAKVYFNILEDKKEELQEVFLGDVLHNLGIVKVHTSSYMEAAEYFRNAYQKNKNDNSLIAYVVCLKLGKNETILSKEEGSNFLDVNKFCNVFDKIVATMEEAKTMDMYQKLEEIKREPDDNRFNEYQKELKQMIMQWKDEYKNGLI